MSDERWETPLEYAARMLKAEEIPPPLERGGLPFREEWKKNRIRVQLVTLILTTTLSEQELDRVIDTLYQTGFDGTFSKRDGVFRVVIHRWQKNEAVKTLDKYGIQVAGVEE